MSTISKRWMLWALSGLLLVAACGSTAGGDATASTSAPFEVSTTAPVVTSVTEVSTTPDTLVDGSYVWPEDVTGTAGFWASMRMAAFEIYRFRTLEELADSASIVMVGVPVGPGPTALIGGDPDNNEMTTVFSLIVEVGVVIRSRTELLGIHTPSVGEQIAVIVDRDPSRGVSATPVVLFLQAPGDDRYYYQIPPEEIAPEYRDYYTEQLAAWEAFRAGKYRFLNSQSLLAGDDRTTVSAMMPTGEDPLASLLSGTPIASIVEMIRSMPPPG